VSGHLLAGPAETLRYAGTHIQSQLLETHSQPEGLCTGREAERVGKRRECTHNNTTTTTKELCADRVQPHTKETAPKMIFLAAH